jgi:hypothetical protein
MPYDPVLTVLLTICLVVVWIVLIRIVLPRFGVST